MLLARLILQINLLVLETDMLHQFSPHFSVSSALHSAITYESPLTPANSEKNPIQINLFQMQFLYLLYIDYILFTHKMGQQKIASVV